MSCSRVRSELSEYLDGDLSGVRLHSVSAHLDTCTTCARHLDELRLSSELVGALPRVACAEALAPMVLDRLEVESRGPGLALLFRSAWAARPLIFPSVVPAAAVVACTLSLIFMIAREDVRASWGNKQAWDNSQASGTDLDPYAPIGGVSAPQATTGRADGGLGSAYLEEAMALMPDPLEEQIFVEATVTRDGRVLDPRLLQGAPHLAAPLMQAIRYQRFQPGREEGRAVAVRTFRLFDSVEVRAPLT